MNKPGSTDKIKGNPEGNSPKNYLQGSRYEIHRWLKVSLLVAFLALLLKLLLVYLFYPLILLYFAFLIGSVVLAGIALFKNISFCIKNYRGLGNSRIIIHIVISIAPFIMIFDTDIGLLNEIITLHPTFSINDPSRWKG